jgi:hypothetical protein
VVVVAEQTARARDGVERRGGGQWRDKEMGQKIRKIPLEPQDEDKTLAAGHQVRMLPCETEDGSFRSGCWVVPYASW